MFSPSGPSGPAYGRTSVRPCLHLNSQIKEGSFQTLNAGGAVNPGGGGEDSDVSMISLSSEKVSVYYILSSSWLWQEAKLKASHAIGKQVS